MFRQMPSETTADKLIKECPPEFQVSPKMHQSVTHFKRLKSETIPIVEEFLKPLSKLERVGMLGPTLIQLPPNFAANYELLDAFFSSAPRACYAIEFRHASWQTTETEGLLRRHGVAWVADDTDEADAVIRDTSGFFYVRLRKTDYSDAQLQDWARRLGGLEASVYVRHTDVESPWIWADRLVELTR